MNPEDIVTPLEAALEMESMCEQLNAELELELGEADDGGEEYDPGDLKEHEDFAQDNMDFAESAYEPDFGESADIDFDVEF